LRNLDLNARIAFGRDNLEELLDAARGCALV
jgi:hypothetical protein